jgi:heme oxygenase
MQRPRLALLREATGAIHRDLEASVDAIGYFDSVPKYGDYLQRVHLFYRRFEVILGHSANEWLGLWNIPQRIGWLDDDLDSLSLPPLPLDAFAPPAQTYMGRTQFLGALYVVLGSSLGARVLLQRTGALALPAGRGRIYLTQVAALSHWKRFLDLLEQEPISSLDALGRGAVDTFIHMRAHLTSPRPL